MLLGGFAAGLIGVVKGRPRAMFDRGVLVVGCLGGAIGLGLAVIDAVLRYGD
jgi:hypothetical protein